MFGNDHVEPGTGLRLQYRKEALRLAKLFSALENGALIEQSKIEQPGGSFTHVVGISGPPGVGKSVLTGQLIKYYSRLGLKVAALVIDPSSHATGGAILADRLRVPDEVNFDRVFIRSISSRGALGGIAEVVPSALNLLTNENFDIVLIETVGVGQSEIDIAGVADTTIVVQAPGAGDGIQGLKSGLLEIADILVLNKSDLSGADRALLVLREVAAASGGKSWYCPVITCIAINGVGIDELVEAIRSHYELLDKNNALAVKRLEQVERQLCMNILAALRKQRNLSDYAEAIVSGKLSLREAVNMCIANESISFDSKTEK